jgi:hypothetical protein
VQRRRYRHHHRFDSRWLDKKNLYLFLIFLLFIFRNEILSIVFCRFFLVQSSAFLIL